MESLALLILSDLGGGGVTKLYRAPEFCQTPFPAWPFCTICHTTGRERLVPSLAPQGPGLRIGVKEKSDLWFNIDERGNCG